MSFLSKLFKRSSHASTPRKSASTPRKSASTPRKSFDDLISEFDKAAGNPQNQARIIQQAANLVKTDIQKFEVATRYVALKSRNG